MKNKSLSDEQIEAVIEAFQTAIEQDVWTSSAFLRVMGKKLETLYEGFKENVELKQAKAIVKEGVHHTKRKPKEKQLEVFVLLYSSDGMNIRAWEQILINLPRQIVSRPVYSDEGDVVRAIQAKKNKASHAYTSIYINETDMLVIPEDKIPKDKQGISLLTLNDKALTSNQIVRFVHGTSVYTYAKGRLRKDLDQDLGQ